MILQSPASAHAGKMVEEVSGCGGIGLDGLVMCDVVTIKFTDGSRIVLRPDWRGADCYISQVTE